MYRRRDPLAGLPVADTNTAADWAQTTGDVINGRKVRYPGWDLDTFFFTYRVTETAVLTIAIAPDNAYQTIIDQIDSAQSTIQIESLTFENTGIANALIEATNRGVGVTVLLEGAPAGGITDQEKHVCQQIENAGGQCWFMVNDSEEDVFDRYRFLHAKFMLIDGARAVIGSENMSINSLTNDDKRDGTWGRRGVVLVTTAPGVIDHLQTIFDRDFDFANHVDLFRWQATHATYGAPSPGFVPITETGGMTYTVRYETPTTLSGTFAFEIVQSPENSLRDQDGLLGLVNRVGDGDTLLVQQLSERPYWGVTTSNGTEQSNKGNRELALQIQSDEAYTLLAGMFTRDWPHRTLLPLVQNQYQGPAPYVLLSEILYDPAGPDDAEFIELANPTPDPIDLSHYGLGDAVNRSDFEDVRRFPPGTTIASGKTIVVATGATAFKAEYGANPDFEILNTDPTVPDLIDDTAWGMWTRCYSSATLVTKCFCAIPMTMWWMRSYMAPATIQAWRPASR